MSSYPMENIYIHITQYPHPYTAQKMAPERYSRPLFQNHPDSVGSGSPTPHDLTGADQKSVAQPHSPLIEWPSPACPLKIGRASCRERVKRSEAEVSVTRNISTETTRTA